MLKKRYKRTRFFLHILFLTALSFSGCADKKNGVVPNQSNLMFFESEMKAALHQLDSFSEKEREKGANAIRKSAYFDYINTLSESLDPKDEAGCIRYLDATGKALKGLQPVVSALFISAADIYPGVKEKSFDSLRRISFVLLNMIHTAYSIRNTTRGNENAKAIHEDALEILNYSKFLNEDIITFFRNENYHSS